jgi:pimeloyl-ACP methyl ester carboxylesterase
MLNPRPTQVNVLPCTICRAISMILLLALLAFIMPTRSYSQGTQVERRKGTTTAQYGFLEYLPPDYNVDTNKKFPTIVFLHGVGEKGNGTTDLYKVAANGPPRLIKDGKWPVKSPVTGLFPAENFIVISVQSSDGYPLPDNMHTFIKWVKTNYRADPDRTYLCGLSAGGISTWRYLDKHSDEVAAIIPVCGNGNISGSDECATSMFRSGLSMVIKILQLTGAVRQTRYDLSTFVFPSQIRSQRLRSIPAQRMMYGQEPTT